MTEGPTPIGETLAAEATRIRDRLLAAGAIANEPEPEVEDPVVVAWRAVVPARYGDPTLDDLDPEPRAQIAEWVIRVAAGEEPNLVLTGPVGSGKTHAAYAALRAIHAQGLDVVAVSVPEWLEALRPSGDEALVSARVLRRLPLASVALLDDLGAEKASEWSTERVASLLHRRWELCAPLIVTTNLAAEPLAEHLGERAYSRLVHTFTAVRLGGTDRRRS